MTIIEARTKSHHSTNMTLVGPWSTRILLSAYPPAVNRNTWPAFCTIYNNKSSVGKMLLVLMFVGGVGSGNLVLVVTVVMVVLVVCWLVVWWC